LLDFATQTGVPHEARFRRLRGAAILPAFFRPATEFKCAGEFDASRSDTPATANRALFDFPFSISIFPFHFSNSPPSAKMRLGTLAMKGSK
jgi:hypothetical protein